MTQAEQSVELELTFLAREVPPEIGGVEPVRLLDIYVPDNFSVHPRLRLRQSGGSYSLTKKLPARPGDASVHTESTIPLNQAEFDSLAKCSKRRVCKDRYVVTIGGQQCEVDVFLESLSGLVLLDFEFTSEAAKDSFQAPAICLADVTQEDFIAGGLLAGRSIRDLQADLDRFHYKPLVVSA